MNWSDKAFLAYRQRGGIKRSLLLDFYIGSHVTIRSYQPLTRDQSRYTTYYPTLDIISPA